MCIFAIKRCECFNSDVNTFERLNSANEQQDRMITQTKRLASAFFIARSKECMLYSGRNDFK